MNPPENDSTNHDVYLLTIVEVDRDNRILCQADGCGHSVYKRIHVVLVGKEFKVLGSQCFRRLYGHLCPAGTAVMPRYGSIDGRRLTVEERLVLVDNTAKFIEQLETERAEIERLAAAEAAEAAERRREEDNLADAHLRNQVRLAAQRPHRPQFVSEDLLSPSYEGPGMLRWRWRDDKARAAESLAAYKANPSPGSSLDIVVKCFEKLALKTPYLFVLDVELEYCMPKRYALRALDELGLIEQ